MMRTSPKRTATGQTRNPLATFFTILMLIAPWMVMPYALAQDNTKPTAIDIPDGWLPTPLVIQLMGNIRKEKGDAAALEFLNQQFKKRATNAVDFRVLFHDIWQNAQSGDGRADNEWGSRLNDIAFFAAHEAGFYAESFQILNNLCSQLSAAQRHGRLAEIHDFVEKCYLSAGTKMDISSYPDKGPALPRLPHIRHRDVSIKVPFSQSFPEGRPVISRVAGFGSHEVGTLLNYAFYKSYRGHWQDGLEWMLWVRDWSSDAKGLPTQARSGSWYLATMYIAKLLNGRGFQEEALEILEKAFVAPYGMDYRGRPRINLELQLLNLKREMGQPDPDTIPKLRALAERIEKHPHFGKSSHTEALIMLANALLKMGQQAEGEALLEKLIAEGSQSARFARIDHWISIGRTEGVENELIALLQLERLDGLKYDEIGLYARYADFLEKAGRLDEALLMRREAVRICKSFDVSSHLPYHLAKLATLLLQLGDKEGCEWAKQEVEKALLTKNISQRYVADVRDLLQKMNQMVLGHAPKNNASTMTFQPQQSMVIPIKGMPWKTYVSLSNSSSSSRSGQLKFSGAKATLSVDATTSDILIELGADKTSNGQALDLVIAPGSYRLISISATAELSFQEDLKIKWIDEEGSHSCESVLKIEDAEEGVQSAVLQAGKYQTNPFYGTIIYLSYLSKSKDAESPALRFKTSQPGSVEIYLMDGTPLAIDGQGNGSLSNTGDELFGASDNEGNLRLPLGEGNCFFQIRVYPNSAIAKEGLLLDVEVFDGTKWHPYSQNRIMP